MPDRTSGASRLCRRVALAHELAASRAALTVATVGQVWVSVPYLGYNQAVRPPGKSLMIRVVPLRLPSLIP
ncbi:MAG TPA: hypothetical protein EYP49_10690 [Anaerolineae bacterium]|nr:hypothetical protein [Anaerolineae bacterium]